MSSLECVQGFVNDLVCMFALDVSVPFTRGFKMPDIRGKEAMSSFLRVVVPCPDMLIFSIIVWIEADLFITALLSLLRASQGRRIESRTYFYSLEILHIPRYAMDIFLSAQTEWSAVRWEASRKSTSATPEASSHLLQICPVVNGKR